MHSYQYAIAAIISNMANVAAHGGKVKHIPGSDLFSVTRKFHDPYGQIYFLSIARDRIAISSYNDDGIQKRVETWAVGEPALLC